MCSSFFKEVAQSMPQTQSLVAERLEISIRQPKGILPDDRPASASKGGESEGERVAQRHHSANRESALEFSDTSILFT